MAFPESPIINVTPSSQSSIADPSFSRFHFALYTLCNARIYCVPIIHHLSPVTEHNLQESRGVFVCFIFYSLFYLQHLEQLLKQIMHLLNIC